jgi:hypothetical protein
VGNCCETVVCTQEEVEVDSFSLGASQNVCRDVPGTVNADCADQIDGESFQELGSTTQWGWKVGPLTNGRGGTSLQVADAGTGGSTFDVSDGFSLGINAARFGAGACGNLFPHSVNSSFKQLFISFERKEGVRIKARNFFLDKNRRNFGTRFQADPDASPTYEDQIRSIYLKRAATADFICYDMLEADEPRMQFTLHEKTCFRQPQGRRTQSQSSTSTALVVGGACVSLLGVAGFYRMRSLRKRRSSDSEGIKTETDTLENMEVEDGSTPPPLEANIENAARAEA